jgi:hypothetical protein
MSRCCPNVSSRKIARRIQQDARDVARAIARTRESRRSRWERKQVEWLFAHRKPIPALDRLRPHGLTGANDAFILAATVQC